MAKAPSGSDLPLLPFPSRAAFEEWLAAQPADCRGLWLKIAKPGAGVPSISKAEAVEAALCHGWIDGQLGGIDAQWWKTRFTPRGPRSAWSENNRAAALRLIDEGRMTPRGLAEVERAKADGRWEAAYASQSRIAVPDDLQAALAAAPAAAAFFAGLDSANRYAVLYRVTTAKKPETRAKRVAQLVAMLAEGRKIHG